MTTDKQIHANRNNAKKSTGPRRSTVVPAAPAVSRKCTERAAPVRARARRLTPAALSCNAQVLIVVGAAPSAAGNLLWRTLSVCRVETHLDAWKRSNHKIRNKPNLAEPL